MYQDKLTIAITILVLLICLRPSEASYGDIEHTYRSCLNSCFHTQNCEQYYRLPHTSYKPRLDYRPSTSLALVNWRCDEECHYECMTRVSNARLAQGQDVYKYYGHWPFERWFGLEEPASAFFSILNSIPHVVFLTSGNCLSQQVIWHMSGYVKLYALIAINAWIASTIFHAKKTEAAILYDYISALILLTYGLFIAIRMIFARYLRPVHVGILATTIVGFVGYRAFFMVLRPGTIGFTNHLHVCIAIVAATTTLWIVWILSHIGRLQMPNSKLLCLIVQLWLAGASMLEIFDFPPYLKTFDAHSLWHAATVPLGFVWYYYWWMEYLEFASQSSQSKSTKPNNLIAETKESDSTISSPKEE